MPRRPSSSALLPPALLGAAALLAGCAAGPDFQPPDAPAVAAYARGAPETAPQGQRLASGADIPALWWRLYRSEALDALVRDALAASPTLEEARARSAQAAYEAAGAHYRQTVLDGFRQVADALRALQADGQAYQAQDQAWRRAADAERIARDRLRAGGISQFELLDAQRQLLQTRLARVQADAARYADTAALLQALGGGWWNTAPAPAAQAGGS